MTILRTSFPICWKTCFSTIYNSCFSCLWSAPSLNIHAHVCDSKMVLGLGMSQAGQDKTTSWKFYFIYRKCRLISFFLKYDLSRGWTGRGGPHGERHAVATLHCYTVTLLSRCSYTAVTLAHCYTGPASGPRPWLTEISEWNQAEPGPGPQYNCTTL